MIGIVDYKMGNLASVINAFAKVGADATLESDPAKLSQYDKLILPGVGAYGDAMEHLRANSMDEAVIGFAASGKPLLGICLGMQLLFESSMYTSLESFFISSEVFSGNAIVRFVIVRFRLFLSK